MHNSMDNAIDFRKAFCPFLCAAGDSLHYYLRCMECPCH